MHEKGEVAVICMVYRALVRFLSWVDPHVDKKLVSGIEGLEVAWAAHPVACEILGLPLVHMQLLYVPYQLLLLLVHCTAVQPHAAVGPIVLHLSFLFLQHWDLG